MLRDWRNGIGVCVFVASLFGSVLSAVGDEPAAKPVGPPPLSSDPCRGSGVGAKFHDALKLKADFEFEEAALKDVIDIVSRKFEIPFAFDRLALDGAGVGRDTPITFHAKQIRLRSFLRLLLHGLGLTYIIRDEVVLVTTQDESENSLTTGVYNIRDLVAAAKQSKYAADDEGVITESLVDVIKRNTGLPRPGWVDDGGVGTIEVFDGQLIVSQNCRVHEQIEQLLAACRKLVKLQAAKPGELLTAPLVLGESLDTMRIQKILEGQIPQIEFTEKSLADVVKVLADSSGITIMLDQKALDGAGVGSDTPVTFAGQDLSMKAVLNHMLHDLGLTWVIRDDVLLVTTQEEAETALQVRLFPARDLLNIPWERHDDAEAKLSDLIQNITGLPKPGWVPDGGVGSLRTLPFAEALVVNQMSEVHDQIANLLSDMRRLRAGTPVAAPVAGKDAPRRVVRAVLQVGPGSPGLSPTEVLGRIQRSIEPESWTQPNIVAEVVGPSLVIIHTPNVQRRCFQLLHELRDASEPLHEPRAAGGFH